MNEKLLKETLGFILEMLCILFNRQCLYGRGGECQERLEKLQKGE